MEKIMWPCSGVEVVRTRSLVVTGLGLDGYDLHSSPGMWYQDKVRPRLIHKPSRRGSGNLIFALYSKWCFYIEYNTIFLSKLYIPFMRCNLPWITLITCRPLLLPNLSCILFLKKKRYCNTEMLWMHSPFQGNTPNSIYILQYIPAHFNSRCTD